MACIYCGSDGPFSAEHVFPVGLGGNDKQWIIRDKVCATCNTDVFSRFEARVLKSSIIAIPRMFSLGLRPRRTGKRPQRNFAFTKNSVVDTTSGRNLKIEIGRGGTPEILPQIWTDGNSYEINGKDRNEIYALLYRVREFTDGLFSIASRALDADERKLFQVYGFKHQRSKLESFGAETVSSLPSEYAWLDRIEPQAKTVPSVIYMRRDRVLVGEFPSAEAYAAELITLSYSTISEEIAAQDAHSQVLENPRVSLTVSTDFRDLDRMLVKISLNTIYHLFAVAPERLRGDVANYVLTGDGQYLFSPIPHNSLPSFEITARRHQHLVLIQPFAEEIAVTISLFGSFNFVGRFVLYETNPRINAVSVIVDHESETIEALPFDDFLLGIAQTICNDE
ncbi:hypothetical protein [Salinarimonas sp.]|uniref:hypothetical protein n=1 Tax=Salinarimonas sp. TaxID=2766526 RepID=UPI00391D52A0